MASAAGSGTRAARVGAATSLALLVAVLCGLLVHVHRFAETRFFTVDEYQYAHATWLVAQGQVPYRDFYEHHFPGSYVLHAPLLPESGSFSERALFLREIPFCYFVGACALLALATWVETRSPHRTWHS